MRNRVNKILKNRGVTGFLILLLMILLFSAGQSVICRIQDKEVEHVVYSYIQKELDAEYLENVIKADSGVGKVLSWDGDASLRWNGITTRLATSKSTIKARYSTSEQEFQVKEIFVLEKIEGEWSVVWHDIVKKDEIK